MSTQSLSQIEHAGPSPNWRRITRHPRFMEFQRLVMLVLVANFTLALWAISNGLFLSDNGVNLALISNLALINFAVAILIRQQRVVNGLFWLATRIPTSWPLWICWGAGKVFHFGGIHISGNISGTLWFAVLLAGLAWNFLHGVGNVLILAIGLSASMLGLLALMILTALGPIRAKFHNMFERTHRFAGWLILALFWCHSIVMIHDAGTAITQTASFWMLCIITASIISPWLSLKKVLIEVIKPSSLAVAIRFNYGDTPFPGSSNAISGSPLLEWHSFANIPAPGEVGYHLIISRAGDWTGRFIDNPPSHVRVKGITTSGVARVEVLFKKVVYIATGSDIGPVMPHLLAKDVPIKLIWSTRSPRQTYGDDLIDEILQASPDALLWDTDSRGKPDLSQLALQAVRDFDAEAVICISNQKLTRKVVHDMESLGIPPTAQFGTVRVIGMYETIIVEKSDRVVTVPLGRPEALNALNTKMLEEILQATV